MVPVLVLLPVPVPVLLVTWGSRGRDLIWAISLSTSSTRNPNRHSPGQTTLLLTPTLLALVWPPIPVELAVLLLLLLVVVLLLVPVPAPQPPGSPAAAPPPPVLPRGDAGGGEGLKSTW